MNAHNYFIIFIAAMLDKTQNMNFFDKGISDDDMGTNN